MLFCMPLEILYIQCFFFLSSGFATFPGQFAINGYYPAPGVTCKVVLLDFLGSLNLSSVPIHLVLFDVVVDFFSLVTKYNFAKVLKFAGNGL